MVVGRTGATHLPRCRQFCQGGIGWDGVVLDPDAGGLAARVSRWVTRAMRKSSEGRSKWERRFPRPACIGPDIRSPLWEAVFFARGTL